MTAWWLALLPLPVVAGIAAGAVGTARRSFQEAATVRRATAQLLATAGSLGFAAASAGDAAAELGRFTSWLEQRWRHSDDERRRLETVLAGLTEGIVLLDARGAVLLVNAAASQLWPHFARPLTGKSHVELFQDAGCERAVSTALASGEPEEAQITRPGPPKRHWRVRVLPIAADTTREHAPGAGALVVVQDITEHRAAEQMRRDFVANVSHELQTPLTSIRGYAETLLETADLTAPERTRFAGHILREADRMTALVRDLLVLSALETPRWAPAAPVDLSDLAREVCDAQATAARTRHVRLTVQAAQAVTVAGRADELRQALDNLVRNALAYTPRGGSATVRVERRSAEAAVIVADTGIGIPSEALPRIFERFYRVDRGRSRATGGTGLGLAIVKHTAEGHGGRVTVESEPGAGSTFTLLLPAAGRDGRA